MGLKAAGPLVRVEHLCKEFVTSDSIVDRILHRKRRVLYAIDDISLNVFSGEVVALVGETGCGKSTLGRCIIGFHKPTSGRIFFQDEDILGLSKTARLSLKPRMQMIFQNPFSSLNPRMRVADILAEPLIVLGKLSKTRAHLEVLELLELVGLPASSANKYPSMFSGGQRQRISIARALAVKPKFIVADEPVSALDVSIQAQILECLLEIRQTLRLAMLFITHDLSVVRYLADRVAVMYQGCIVELASTEDLFRNPKHPYTRALLDAVPALSPGLSFRNSKVLKGEISAAYEVHKGCCFSKRCSIARSGCFTEKPELVEVLAQHNSACWAYIDPVRFSSWSQVSIEP